MLLGSTLIPPLVGNKEVMVDIILLGGMSKKTGILVTSDFSLFVATGRDNCLFNSTGSNLFVYMTHFILIGRKCLFNR